jgi:diaminopimelate epimerase
VPSWLYRRPEPALDGVIDAVPGLVVPMPPDDTWEAGTPDRIVLSGLLVSTGEPHLVLFSGMGLPSHLEDLIFPAGLASRAEISASSRLVAHIGEHVNTAYRDLFPAGVHLNLARMAGDRSIEYRTYERAIDRETLACGSGAVATAHVAAELKLISSARATLWPYRSRLRQPDSRLQVEAGESGYVLRGDPRLICTCTVPATALPWAAEAVWPAPTVHLEEVPT